MIRGAVIADASMQATTPASHHARLAEARALFQSNEPAQAEALLRTVQAREPAAEDVGMLLAEVQRSQGRFSAAAGTLSGLCRAHGFEPDLSLRCVEFIRQCDRHAVAAQICAGALARGATSPELLLLTGNVARELGDFETARAQYLAALDGGVDLDHHHVLNALANTRHYVDAADPEIARFAQVFADGRFHPRPRASAGFALAKAQGDLADYATASRTLRRANAMLRPVWHWAAATWEQFVGARARDPNYVPRFKKRYNETIKPELMKKFGYTNAMQVPKINKIVLNIGAGEAASDGKKIQAALNDLTAIAGQKAIITRAKKAIATYKIREGLPIGVKVTLRGDVMYEFIDRLITMALPRVRDFRGVNPKSFDGRGNYALGLKEHIVFVEIDYDRTESVWGMDVIVNTSANTDEEAKALLEGFQFPFTAN